MGPELRQIFADEVGKILTVEEDLAILIIELLPLDLKTPILLGPFPSFPFRKRQGIDSRRNAYMVDFSHELNLAAEGKK